MVLIGKVGSAERMIRSIEAVGVREIVQEIFVKGGGHPRPGAVSPLRALAGQP